MGVAGGQVATLVQVIGAQDGFIFNKEDFHGRGKNDETPRIP